MFRVGAFANRELFAEVKALAKEHGSRVYLPSGAISGLDGLKSARIGTIRSVTLTTTKNPGGLKGAPYIVENKIDLDLLAGPTLIFEGSALQAVRAFPANVNVAATLFLACGESEVKVKIVADPNMRVAEGDLVDTDHGVGEVIDEDVSSPPKMAAYLENWQYK